MLAVLALAAAFIIVVMVAGLVGVAFFRSIHRRGGYRIPPYTGRW